MKISLGDPTLIRVDDGVSFLAEPVRMPGWAFTAYAIVVTESVRQKALELLPSAQAMAASKATRVNFFSRSRESLGLEAAVAFQEAEQEAAAAEQRAQMLFALAKQENVMGSRVIGVEQWREILAFFNQDLSVGAAQTVEG
jgi:hypothetical protein